ncbi:MAG: tRNA (N(6)-L-threonylcarbamoyladenosine(37)-C(2))-methylthiotransferase [Archaeoglobales archaeon]|nr:tRNA (N(6)-L-threonylcarbamoyladenosine(37)-C(2))-methylthiotransferase [Archaeoglobales archaeon]
MRVAIETYGCTMNQADSDIIRGILAKEFEISDVSDAEVVVINSCSVIDFTERKIIRRIKELKASGKKVVLAGCMARTSKEALELSDAAVSPDNLEKIAEAVKNSKKIVHIGWKNLDKAEMHEVKCRLKENAIAIVSISEGCVGECSYCITRFARGPLRSFSIDNILKEVKGALDMGYKEIQLTSQDTGAYGIDKGYQMLPKLLKYISEIPGNFRVRVGMMNPHHAKSMLEELIEAYESEKIYKFIHLPVQSGDNDVLKHMRRNYSVEDFIDVVRAFREAFDDLTLSTDVIVGYPTENEESFMKTYELMKRVKPDIVNITRFSPRPGTPAANLKDIPGWKKKIWSRKLTELCRNIGAENNSKFVGKKSLVLLTEYGKNSTVLARTNSYKAVITKGKLGEFKVVKIKSFTYAYLVADDAYESL